MSRQRRETVRIVLDEGLDTEVEISGRIERAQLDQSFEVKFSLQADNSWDPDGTRSGASFGKAEAIETRLSLTIWLDEAAVRKMRTGYRERRERHAVGHAIAREARFLSTFLLIRAGFDPSDYSGRAGPNRLLRYPLDSSR